MLVDPGLILFLEERQVACALIGGVALGVHGAPRYTADTDLLTMSREVLAADFWNGYPVQPEVRSGDFEDPLEGVVRWEGERLLDLIVGRGRAMRYALETAEEVEAVGVRVVSALGLVLLKLEAGSPQDKYDIASLVDAQRLLNGAPWLSALPAQGALLSPPARALLEEMRPQLLP